MLTPDKTKDALTLVELATRWAYSTQGVIVRARPSLIQLDPGKEVRARLFSDDVTGYLELVYRAPDARRVAAVLNIAKHKKTEVLATGTYHIVTYSGSAVTGPTLFVSSVDDVCHASSNENYATNARPTTNDRAR